MKQHLQKKNNRPLYLCIFPFPTFDCRLGTSNQMSKFFLCQTKLFSCIFDFFRCHIFIYGKSSCFHTFALHAIFLFYNVSLLFPFVKKENHQNDGFFTEFTIILMVSIVSAVPASSYKAHIQQRSHHRSGSTIPRIHSSACHMSGTS